MKKEIYLVLDNIRSRENVGSIFRTADGAGVSKILLCGITSAPPHGRISKTALGAEMYVPWEYRRNTRQLLTELKTKGIKIIALEQTAKSKNIFTFKLPNSKALALIVGNEVNGISPKILKYCDKVLYIPMSGRKESLNVSVAAGVALYQLIK